MLWIISGAGLLFLLYLLRKVQGSAPPQPSRSAPLEEALPDYLASLAHRPLRRSPGRLYLRRQDLHMLDASLRRLRSLPKEELLPAARVLNDHGRFLQEEAAALMRSLAHASPIPAYGDGETRLGCFARELFAHTDAALTPEGLEKAVETWQKQTSFTVTELTLLPGALRLALLTLLAELAAQCAAEQQTRQAALLTVAALRACKEKRAQKLFRTYRHNKLYLSTLLNDIHQASEGDAAIWSRQLPLLYELSARQLTDDECTRQSGTVRWVSHAIDSLQRVGHMPWNRLSEQWDRCHTLLDADPIYGQMDEESRAAYRQRVEMIGRYGQRSAQAVCDAAFSLAQGFAPEDVRSHVGYYLLDGGMEQLLAALRLEKSLSLRLRLGIGLSLPYRCLTAVPAPALLFLFLWAGCHPAAALPVALLIGAAAAQGIRAVFSRLTLPKIVPRLQLDSIPQEAKTLVVCPVMLLDRQHALGAVRNLSILQKANPDPNLHYLLLGDFRDSMAGSLISDTEIVETAAAAIEALREEGTFFYLQRERIYHLPDHVHMARERKRGALETVMKLITAQPQEDRFAYESIPADSLAGQYRYMIALDQHMLMPPGAALRMVGAMLHPLHRRCAAEQGMRGVSVIRPAVQPALLRERTQLDRLLGQLPVSGGNAAQARFEGDGPGIGASEENGIIDPKAFLSAAQGQLIPGGLLNTDLPEDLLGGCLRAPNIVLWESRTESLQDRLRRLHRQTRGIWQLLPYLLDRLPAGLRPEKNTLLRKDRRLIRRALLVSLLQPLQLLSVVLCIALGEGWLLAAALLAPLLPWLAERPGGAAGSLLYLLFLPIFALTRLDAVGRTLYRLFVSRQHLLDLIPAAESVHSLSPQSMAAFYMSMAAAGGISLLCLLPGSLRIPGLLLAGCFAAAPFVLPLAENAVHRPFRPTDYMREVLVRLAKNTLLFFETAITPQDHGLPPDNVQIEPNKGISHHTTPANIGLYLCALIAAQMLDLLTPDEAALRIRAAADTLERLPKWNGHLYTRYDTRTLQVQQPAAVSTEASGILAVCLTTAAQGLRCLLDSLHPADRELPQRLDALAEGMQFAPLYDPEAELFHTGADPEKGLPTESHNEWLAGEGRLASFYAVATGQVPLRHWVRLGRTRVRTPKGQTLLSGTGSLSAYLLPFLFQPPMPGSLLTEAARNAVLLQASDKQQGVWGVSESGYYAFDPHLYYRSKTSGAADLAMDPETEADVIAPYAAVLSLPFAPKAAFFDLLKLQSLGLEGPLGLFEAADLNPLRIGEGHPFRLVHSHTARHQGMILCAVCNFLCNHRLAGLFYQLPAVQAYRLLLEEPMQPLGGVVRDPLRQICRSNDMPSLFAACRVNSLQFPVNAHVLRGAGATLVVNAAGGGFLRKNGWLLTRFEDSCHIPSGIRLYLRDSQSGAYWQTADPGAAAVFETAQAVFSLSRNELESELRIFVDPLSGAAVHALTVQNRSEGQRMLEVCSYLEPALLPEAAPQQGSSGDEPWLHSRRLGTYGVSLRRRQAAAEDGSPVLWHLLTADTPMNVFHIQTSRLSFIGRGRTIYAPRELDMPLSGLADTVGDVPEPCASLRGQFVLPGKGSARFVFVTHMPGTAEAESAFLLHCGHPDSVLSRYDAALTQALVTAQTFGLTPDLQLLLAPVCGLLCYSGQPGQNRWADGNTLPLSGLKELNIEGVGPIAVWECSAQQGLDSAEILLRMHACCHIGGFRFDLVFLLADDAPTALYRALREQILHSPGRELLGQSGGIHLFEPGKPTPELRSLLFAAARLALKDRDGTLEQQLTAMQRPAQSRPVYQQRSPVAWKLSLPVLPELLLSNGCGGFTPEEGDYVITLPPGRQTPAPWYNLLGNNHFGTLATESGLLFTAAENGQPHTLPLRDPLTPCGSESFFLRDENHRLLWSLTRQPLGCHLAVRVTHAPGETVYESSGYGIYSRMHCFTDLSDPLGLRVIHLRNEDTAERILTFCHSLLPQSGAQGQLYRVSRAGNGFLMDIPGLEGVYGSCMLDQDASILSVMSAGTFHGLWGVAPAALSGGELPTAEEGQVALLCTTVQLKPGESRTLVCAVGYGKKRSALNSMFRQLQSDGATRRLHRVKQYWEHRLSALRFDLPDQGLCLLLNRWLPYQIRAARQWLPAGLYPPDPEEGFRACLERIPAMLHTEPGHVRESLLCCARMLVGNKARKTRSAGNGQTAGLAGDLLLLPWMTALYAQETQDRSILEEALPLSGSSPDAQENADAPESDRMTLQDLCLELLLQTPEGAHGLPEQGGSSPSRPGESVWLGMLLCESLRRFAPLCTPAAGKQLLEKRQRLLQRIDRCGWDGSWYLCGWHANGTPMGSREEPEGSLSLLPQAWAVVCGASRDRCQSAMENVWRLLYHKGTGLLRLLAPPFSDARQGESPPGVGGNGGQITQTAGLTISALHQLGQEDRAWELALCMLPTHHTATRQLALRYRSEPYAIPGWVCDHPRQRGMAFRSWEAGSAASLMAAITDQLLGFSKYGDRLRFRPVLPAGWDEVRLSYRYGNTTYHLHASRACTAAVCDGELLTDGTLALTDDGRIHEASFPAR